MRANQVSEESTIDKELKIKLSAEVVGIQIKSLALIHAVRLLSDQQDYATLQKLSSDLTMMLNHCVERFGLQQYSELFRLPIQTSRSEERRVGKECRRRKTTYLHYVNTAT